MIIGTTIRRAAAINLLTNAIRHNDKSVPEVLVSTQDVTLQKTRRLVINVQDNGPGIPARNREVIFEKFASIPSRAGGKGVGLGLPITRQIINKLDGKLSFLSNDDGTVFRIELPLTACVQECKMVAWRGQLLTQ